MEREHYKFSLLPLPYDYSALEPYIDSETIYLHHDRHLKTYVENLNLALQDYPNLKKLTLEELILNQRILPDKIRQNIINNAGGVYNHNLYFQIMGKCSIKEPQGMLKKLILKQYSSMENFKALLKKTALSQFGSGWGWLTVCRSGGLRIISTANQNCPISMNLFPLIPLDVWEHAYYLKYQNRRTDYIDNWFNVINWGIVENHFDTFYKKGKI